MYSKADCGGHPRLIYFISETVVLPFGLPGAEISLVPLVGTESQGVALAGSDSLESREGLPFRVSCTPSFALNVDTVSSVLL